MVEGNHTENAMKMSKSDKQQVEHLCLIAETLLHELAECLSLSEMSVYVINVGVQVGHLREAPSSW